MPGLLDSCFEEVGGLEENGGEDARPQTSCEALVKSVNYIFLRGANRKRARQHCTFGGRCSKEENRMHWIRTGMLQGVSKICTKSTRQEHSYKLTISRLGRHWTFRTDVTRTLFVYTQAQLSQIKMGLRMTL